MVLIYAVCLGNICRSPIAESVLRHELAAAGLADQVEVTSAGTAGYHQGEDADRRTKKVLADHGYELNHSAQKFTGQMLANADLVLVMDSSNYADVLSLSKQVPSTTGVPNEDKIKLMLSFLPAASNPLNSSKSWDPSEMAAADVPDPWYGNMHDFEQVLNLIETATPGVVAHIQDELR